MARGRDKDVDYMLDPQGRPRFFGLYEGTVVDINDPLKKNRIKLSVTITGKETTNWARCLLPTTVNSNHPDHAEHTAAQIAALLTTTAVSVTDSRGDTETVPALTVVALRASAERSWSPELLPLRVPPLSVTATKSPSPVMEARTTPSSSFQSWTIWAPSVSALTERATPEGVTISGSAELSKTF